MPQVTIGDSYLPLADWSLRDQFVLVEGRRGTSKTRSILSVLLCRALQFPGSRWALVRSTRTRLSGTVLQTLEQQVFPAFGLPVPGKAGQSNRTEYRLPNGSSLVPVGLDDETRGQSAEYAGVYLAEVGELDNLIIASSLAGSMRQSVPGMPVHQLIADINPVAPGHWSNQIAEPAGNDLRLIRSPEDYHRTLAFNARPCSLAGRWKRIITSLWDNPGYTDAKAWKILPDGESYLKTLDYLPGYLRARWVDGLWAAAEGSVYGGQFVEEKHVVVPFDTQDWPIYVFWDPGYDHPAAILWIAIAPNGCYYVIDEIYTGGKSVDELCEMIHQRNAGRTVRGYYGDPQHIFNRTAQSPKSIAQQAKESRHSITLSGWPRTQGNAIPMVNAVRERFMRIMLKFFACCPNTIREHQSWMHKRTAGGELPAGDDAFEDKDNHTCDCVKGAVALNLRHAPGKIEVVG
jgi:hypothetical protein